MDDKRTPNGDELQNDGDGFDFLTHPFAAEETPVREEPLLAAVPEPEPEAPAVPVAPVRPFAVVPAAPEPEPEPEVVDPEPVAVVESEPVVVAEPEPEPEPEPEKVPWYKREIGGKKQAEQPAAREERRPRRRLRPEPQASVEEQSVSPKRKTDEERVPFYKRELSFGRKKTEDVATERAPSARRERTLRRRIDATTEVTVVEEAPTEERKPLYKRELSFRRRSHPSERAERAPKPDKPARKEKKARRELSLPKFERSTKPKGKKNEGDDGKRHKRLIGLKIGASQLAAAQVVNNGHAELVKVARESLLDGVISGGELRDPEALTLALRTFFKKHKLPRRNVRLGIANNRIGVRTFEITGIDDAKQLANAVRFRAQEALPIPIEEAVLDWRILSETTDEEGQLTRRILLVVAYRELIDRYVSACRKAGIQLVGIDLEAFALLRALGDGDRRAADDGALVAVSVGHERSTFAVSDGEICEFTRVLEWGGNSLNVAIARALDKAPSEVEELKRALSLEGDDDLPEDVDPDTAAKARDAVTRQLQTFARELVSSLQFYQGQPGSLGIGEIILTGGTTQMPGLARELERLIGVRVRVGDPLQRVKVAKKLAGADELGSLSVAIGLGIEA